ncbi:PX domain containing protein [Trichomonas vaginalis G3]|uniref:PX domain containing protein n=1 Tax=Trichomonas vaginalis (strain ATCC PRA-98 / G3) TaxID=412133 RepID=A2FGV5_TRIV3|nr:PX domain family [Trichomonas vaginalis G3]EAX95859.1 PX domain containing protein [Trichomonas vaginalis G3]KAI5488677.1 PX domain family [Trichomonas vaginalis G3]|eukprot:XP_001308789.1 PX domain containing protein [Trichomonas vaginalis G3]
MKSYSLTEISPHAKSLLDESPADPKVFIACKVFEDDETSDLLYVVSLELGVMRGDKVKSKEVFKRAGDFEAFDKIIQTYFREFKFLDPLPSKKALVRYEKLTDEQRIESIESYFFKLLQIPGIVILPAFLEFFNLDADLFMQE